MGDTLFHFLFPLMALLIARLRFRHRISVSVMMAASAALLDVDHFFGLEARATLHNIFFTLLFPLVLYAVAFIYEKRGNYYKNIFLALLLVWFSHPMIDIFTGGAGVKLLYPVSNQQFLFNSFQYGIPLPTGVTGYVISSNGIGLTVYSAMILAVIFVEDFNKYLMKLRKPEKALIEAITYEERKIKKEL